LGIKASYYFRAVPESFDKEVITEIANLGHEICYHYEDFSLAKGDWKLAIQNFEKNLTKLREIYPVSTMCMHGSPLSKYDNRLLWSKYQYRDYGILADAYFDINFNEVFYLTDAGRSWNNRKVSVRDYVETHFDIPIRSIHDIFKLIENGNLPDRVMLNIHPHNWSDNIFEWLTVWGWQGLKNVVKRMLIISRSRTE